MTAFFKKSHVPVSRKLVTTLTANGTIALPALADVRRIYFEETAGGSVTGGLRVGTSAAGTQLVTAQAIAAGALVSLVPTVNALLKTAQVLYIEAVTAWAAASVNVVVEYKDIAAVTKS